MPLIIDKKIGVHLAMFSVALFYAANYSIAKWAMPQFISPFAFITVRVGVGAIFFGAYYFLFGKEKIQSKSDYVDLAICAFFGVALNMLAFFKGLSMTSAINASVLMLLSPIMVVLYTAIGNRSWINYRVVIGIFISFLGAALLVNVGSFSFISESFRGDLLIMLNASSFAFHLYYVARLLKKYKAITVTAFMFMFGFVFVLPVGYADFAATDWSAFTSKAVFALVFVVIFVTIINYILNVWAVQNSSSTQAGSYIYLQPLLATLIAVALGMDVLTPSKATYGLLIVAGLYLVNKGKSKI